MNAETGAIVLPATPPRARGAVRLSAHRSGTHTRLKVLHQSGSAKALLPRTFEAPLTAVLLNTAGGITGGDRFCWQADALAGAHLTVTTQAAERLYRALPHETGHVETTLGVGPDARIDWLPQETIVFDGAALKRSLSVDLDRSSRFLGCESFILGRAAMGEQVRDLRLDDHWRVRRNGQLIYADSVRIHGDAAGLTSGPATLNGHRAFASVLYAAPDSGRFLAPLRDCLGETGGASLIREGVLLARLSAPDGFELRHAMIPVLRVLRGAELPRVWSL